MKSDELKKTIMKEAKKLEKEVISIRRHIHMHPETMYEEENTAQYIQEKLTEIGIHSQRIAGTGVLAKINESSSGKVLALRADIDALNINEETKVSYKSRNIGKMHACGHDAHTAMLLVSAKIIYKLQDHLLGPVKLLFQPAEEGGGGAKKIISEGYFDDVVRVFGIHVWNPLPSGTIGLREGPVFASSDRFKIAINGRGGHAAAPHQSIDPTSVLVDIYNALQKLISREIDPFQSCVLSIPVFEASNAHNIIPSSAILKGTLRTLKPEIRTYMRKRIRDVVDGYSKAWRCNSTVEFDPMAYPAVINDTETVKTLKNILNDVGNIELMEPTMVGEDFSFYLQKSRGAFITLGNFNEGKGIVFPHHHSKFQIDEDNLWKGTAIYTLLGFFYSFID